MLFSGRNTLPNPLKSAVVPVKCAGAAPLGFFHATHMTMRTENAASGQQKVLMRCPTSAESTPLMKKIKVNLRKNIVVITGAAVPSEKSGSIKEVVHPLSPSEKHIGSGISGKILKERFSSI